MGSHYTLAGGLAYVFGREWAQLADRDRAFILRDCTEDGGVQDLAEYRRNIGPGNLQSYADCQRVRFTTIWPGMSWRVR